jgi:hypothetical protein
MFVHMALYEDLGPDLDDLAPPELEEDRFPEDEDDLEPELSEEDSEFLDQIVIRTIVFSENLSGMVLRPYQRELAYRIVESVILADGEEITAVQSRQSGKSECCAIVVSGMMVLFPKLAKAFSIFERFERGLMVGLFAPVDGQSELIYQKVIGILNSQRAKDMYEDPELDEKVVPGAKMATLRSGSFCRRQTAHPKAKIEGSSYHLVILDESQDMDETIIRKSIMPMLAAYAGTAVKIGTPSYHKGDFYKAIQFNKRRMTQRGAKRNHFEYDYKMVSKYNPYYDKFIKKEKLRIGEDSDEFMLSYALKWLLDRGMLITEDVMDYLADTSMQLVRGWNRSPVVVGIDPARVQDSTVVTVMWVDWEHPDPAGYREHRILNWLEINNAEWEDQYYQIYEFLEPYDVARIGVDAQGMGGPIAERLDRILGHRCEVVPCFSDAKNQTERWKHFIQILQRRLLVYPGHSKARRTRNWKRFRQQMEDAEKQMKGNYLLVAAPTEGPMGGKYANDDFVDSAALACYMSHYDTAPEAESVTAPWWR